MEMSSFPEESFTLKVRVEAEIYARFEKFCHGRSLEVPHVVRMMLEDFVRDGTMVRVLDTVDSDGGYMPYGLIKDMVLGMEWQPRKRGRPPKVPA
ncbi:hypothetical protein LJR290_007518 [Variovorax sp. LjRoot290]